MESSTCQREQRPSRDGQARSGVHYKLSSKLTHGIVTFHGLSISLHDLKRQIMDRERLKETNCDLQILKAETNEEYSDDAQIPRNVSVIVRRVPARATNPNEPVRGTSKATPNLAEANATEEDKIKAMMIQSCGFYDPLNDLKTPLGPAPSSPPSPVPKIKRSSGIPMSFMVEVKDPSTKGVMLTPRGKYAIPAINVEAYARNQKETSSFFPEKSSSSSSSSFSSFELSPDQELKAIFADMATLVDTLSLSQLLDLAIGMPQKGAVHFAAMRKLLQAMLGHLDLQYLTTQEPWTGELSGPSLAELAADMKEVKQEMESYKKLKSEAMAVSKHLQEIETLKAAQSHMVQDMKKAQKERDQAMADSQDLREEIDRLKAIQSHMEEDILRMKQALALMKKLEDDIRKLREDMAKWKEESSKQITQQMEFVLQETKSELKKMAEQQDMKYTLLGQKVTETANELSAQDQILLQHMEDTFSKIQGDCDELRCTSVTLQTDIQLKQRDIEMLSQSLERLQKEKADEKTMLAAIDMKADKDSLGSKVEHTQFEESMEYLDERMRKMQGYMLGQKKNYKDMQEKLSDMMENKLDRRELKYFRRRLEDNWNRNLEELEKRILGESAAGIRKQLPVPFTCLSCDRTVNTHVPGPYPETLPYLQPLPPSKDLQHGPRPCHLTGAPASHNPWPRLLGTTARPDTPEAACPDTPQAAHPGTADAASAAAGQALVPSA
ncbi:glutamine-rich protein 2-like protein [Willisornis vidua]|uniref:Glutamine-rich protein 2-like protein n=1 Tax=Willisornis vidua TaxID=1566151 RepID=A0ABQ9DK53_9PASS|nr:glutamine-rich protein 2-like protein [Willisornis vidua]